MKIAQLVLNNFRGYKNLNLEFDKNFNVIIGKNDIGKSTILEALEIFFNNDIVKVEIADCNVHATERNMSITVCFDTENKLYTVDTIPTNLKDEFLLDKNGYLSIKKEWDCSKDKLTASSLKTFIISNYPNTFSNPLVTEKIVDLKKLLDNYTSKLDVTEIKKNTSSEIRKAIYSVSDCTQLTEIEIPIDKEDGKKIYDSLKTEIPLFFIFQSDRQNKDSDKEVQDPLKAITKIAISELETQLEKVKNEIKKKAEEIGNQTLEKLKEMSPEIASVLHPEMTNKAWDSLFSFSFNSDDGIPINKRGSGVRRLILLNYFRAEAERKNADSKNVIYAIEEPETSQHPDWQIQLFNALIKLSENNNTQVITTTHSPSLAGLAQPNKIIFIHKENNQIQAEKGSESNLEKIAKTLGVLPDVSISINDLSIRVIVCLEGPSDIEFFNHISKLFNLDFAANEKVLVLSLGGGTLMHWVNKNYLKKLNKPEIHIYDSDVSKYQLAVNEVNARAGCWATMTNLLEMENYIHPSLYKQIFPIQEEFYDVNTNWQSNWGKKDIPEELSAVLKQLKNAGNINIRNESATNIKSTLAEKAAPLMTIALLEDLGVSEEVSSWFNKIKEKLS